MSLQKIADFFLDERALRESAQKLAKIYAEYHRIPVDDFYDCNDPTQLRIIIANLYTANAAAINISLSLTHQMSSEDGYKFGLEKISHKKMLFNAERRVVENMAWLSVVAFPTTGLTGQSDREMYVEFINNLRQDTSYCDLFFIQKAAEILLEQFNS